VTRSAHSPAAGESQIITVRSAAIDAASAAGALIRGSFRSTLQVDSTDAHDLKLRLDRTCEESIVAILRQRFPAHGVLSEEMGYEPGADPYVWIVDPLDGTVNFFHGIPFFCTCISCHATEEDDSPGAAARLPDGRAVGSTVAAVVYAPLAKELFVATAQGGAFLNGSRLLVKPVADLSEAIVSLSFGARDGSAAFMSRLLPRMIERAQKVRSLGSTALDIVNVAAGRTGAFIQIGTNLWDFAAAAAILREAGGVVDAEEYAPERWKIIACNPGLISDVRKLAAE
jgi:fructose-1,6-bisphosphatase/inositol monophosphatase family enzyme